MIAVESLVPYARNTRTHSAAQIEQVAESISEFGFNNPVLIDADGGIIAGHGRALAAKKLGMDEVPCIRLGHLTDAQKRAYVIADNKLALNAGWDEKMLALEFKDLRGLDFDLALTGFDLQDINAILAADEATPEGKTDADAVPEPQAAVVTKPGDVWVLGKHRVMCGDSTSIDAVKTLLAGASVDMVFTDPPYGISVKTNQDTSTCKEGIMGDDTTEVAVSAFNLCSSMFDVQMIFWGANHYAYDARLPNSACWIAWNKQESNNHIDQADCELAWTNIKSPARQFHHLWAGFRRDSEKGEKRVHPTQKPVALIEEIFNHFKPGKVIIDLFGGSGSTLLACEKTGRKALLMELDGKYADVIVRRWQQFTGKTAILESTGQPFPADLEKAA